MALEAQVNNYGNLQNPFCKSSLWGFYGTVGL